MTKVKIFGYPLAVLAIVVVLGCEKPVSVNIPDHDRQIVARALYSPDSLWQVNVSSSVGFRDTRGPFPLKDATVEIREGSTLIETLVHAEDGVFTGRQSRPEAGKTYTLNVSAPGYESVSAESMLPIASNAPQIVIDQSSNNTEDPYINIGITVDDPPSERNFYAIEVEVIEEYEVDGELQRSRYQYFFETNDVVLLGLSALDGQEETFDSRYFQDDVFDGKTETIDIRVLDPQFDFYDFEGKHTIVLHFYVTNESYFRFFKTAQEQRENEGNPFSEPVRIFSNMSNGFGIFAGTHVYSEVLVASR